MSNTIVIAVLSFKIFESLIVFHHLRFFWIHRSKLKQTSFLLINLAVADLLVGLTEIAVIGTLYLPRHTGLGKVSRQRTQGTISTSFQAALSGVSMFFLVLISLERAFALIWPLRHRVTS